VIVGAAGERRGVALFNRIEPKPVLPNSNDHAVFIIVAAPYVAAVPEARKDSAYLAFALRRSELVPERDPFAGGEGGVYAPDRF
jgi:hypothetical protein